MRHFLLLLLKVNWASTLYFNFKYLGWKKGKKIPILLYKKCHIRGNGSFLLPNNCCFGMIKLGIKHEFSCISAIGIHIENNGIIEFKGSGIIGNGSVMSVKKNAILSFGKNFGMTGDIKIHCHDKIFIGNNFSCSWNVSITDTDFHECLNPNNGEIQPLTRPIRIGDNVWCCQSVIISKGANVPSWNILAANSLVNKSFYTHHYAILAGIPAREISKQLKRCDIEQINQLTRDWKITCGLKLFNKI